MTQQKTPDILALLQSVRSQDYDHYLCTLFAPAGTRHDLWVVLALSCELLRIPGTVSEAMMGMVRLKWWQEHIERIGRGETSQLHEHPVLPLLAPLIMSETVPLSTCEKLCETLGRQLDEPDNPQHVEEAIMAVYTLLAYAMNESDKQTHYQQLGRIHARVAMLRTDIANGATPASKAQAIDALTGKRHEMRPPVGASRFLRALSRLERLWIRHLSRLTTRSDLNAVPPIPLLAIRLTPSLLAR